MFLSVFDMFKVGVGPSSSHTMGPMVAAARFLETLRTSPFRAAGLKASLHGSLAFTGLGHATDRATILGLAGFEPATYDAAKAETVLEAIHSTHKINPPGLGELTFDPKKDLVFDYGPALPGHANGMILKATDAQGDLDGQLALKGTILSAEFLGEAFRYDVRVGQAIVHADISHARGKPALTAGSEVHLRVPSQELRFVEH
jgi:hypothetical protein